MERSSEYLSGVLWEMSPDRNSDTMAFGFVSLRRYNWSQTSFQNSSLCFITHLVIKQTRLLSLLLQSCDIVCIWEQTVTGIRLFTVTDNLQYSQQPDWTLVKCAWEFGVPDPSLSHRLRVSRSKKISVESARWCGGNRTSPRTSALSRPWSCTGEPRRC